MKKSLIIILLIAVLVTCVGGCTTVGTTKYDTEILKGNSFEYETIDKLKNDWKLVSGGTDGSAFTLENNSIKINTNTAGYASVVQRVFLRSYSYYKITYSYTSTSMSAADETKGYIGLFVGFKENPEFNIKDEKKVEQRGSSSGSRKATFYFKTDSIKEANLSINLGTKDNPVTTSSVEIMDISLQRVQKAEALDTTKGASFFNLSSTVFGASTQRNVVIVVLGAILTLILCYAAYMMFARNTYVAKLGTENKIYNKIQNSKFYGVLIAVGFTLLVRLLIMLVSTIIAGGMKTYFFGFEVDMILANGKWMAEYGLSYFFKYNPEAITAPLYLILSAFVGLIVKLFGGSVVLGAFVIKLFAVAADVGVVIVIYKLASKKCGNIGATILASLYALLPITFGLSATWGIWESITVFLMVLTFYFILNKKYLSMVIVYLVACLFSSSALLILPAILMYSIFLFIKNKELRIPIVACLLGGFIIYYLVALPFHIVTIGKGSVMSPFSSFVQAATGAKMYTLNAFNLQAIFGNNFAELTTQSVFVTVLFMIFIVAMVAVGYFRNKNRLDLTLLGAVFVATMFSFTNNMVPAAMYVVLPLLLIYTALTSEKRVFLVFAMYSVLMFVNNAYVLSVIGYSETGVGVVQNAGGFMQVFGAFNVIVTCYFIYVVFDIVASKQAAIIRPLNIPYVTYATNIGNNIKVFFINIGRWFKRIFASKKA